MYYKTAKNVKAEVSPRARRRAKIYKLLESMYLDKEESVCIQHTDIDALILSL